MYSCYDIAKKFLSFAEEEGSPMTPMKLLKLTYIAHGYYLAFYGEPLFKEEIQAWKYGPVIPRLYFTIKIFGQDSVSFSALDSLSNSEIKKKDEKFLRSVYNAYKRFTGLELSSKTHTEDTPWAQTYNGYHYQQIDNNLIKDYYKKKVNQVSNG
ncbi:Panacea domain-containing protein [Nonlabens xiamenensis]|uniref:Panacea domain-containing protein n=1 Tax=Nonlabens xiamenensis TaxID=2341043 RepID=UPI000F60C1A2|nr:type II toxin-antitoxin system antitoxin SocA domain-containing protein [Nonlabens xiamenensis]